MAQELSALLFAKGDPHALSPAAVGALSKEMPVTEVPRPADGLTAVDAVELFVAAGLAPTEPLPALTVVGVDSLVPGSSASACLSPNSIRRAPLARARAANQTWGRRARAANGCAGDVGPMRPFRAGVRPEQKGRRAIGRGAPRGW